MRLRSICQIVLVLVAVLALGACDLIQNGPEEVIAPTVTPTATPELSPTESATVTPVPTESPVPTPAPSPTPLPTPTPEPVPTPTPVPTEPIIATETPCCGLFNWIDERELLVFDQPDGGPQGLWRIDVVTGDRTFVASRYGLSSRSGTIAVPDADQGSLAIHNRVGERIAVVANGGHAGWPSPDGTSVVWLENLPVRTPSSTVDRSVELKIADVSTGQIRSVIQLQTADVQWFPDNRHLLLSARDLNFNQAGIWLLDTETGDYEILFEEIFLRAVRLSPDGEHVLFMRTFNDDVTQNGIWVLDVLTRESWKLAESGALRWGEDGGEVWQLELAHRDEPGGDRLLRIDSVSSEVQDTINLDGRVLNDIWEISPGGEYVAFWRELDGHVVVQPLS